MAYICTTMASLVGWLKLVASDKGLAAVLWTRDNPRRVPLGAALENDDHPVLREAVHQLQEYFSGTRRSFQLELDPRGTAFQKEVWAALLRIPYGQTRTYGEIAREIGRPNAVRAVGAANGRNPLSIVAPCHRVIGATGGLTGFAGGLEAKVKLLSIEGHDYGADVGPRSKSAGAGRQLCRSAIPDTPDLFGL
ncbi:methylated-DNA--[protein]-cysteine S-methyltransferase [Lichenifustis flavocetrariae]|uniref:Methylated-DNA--protein-cysteine methyltransferase n=1 Tax=Lichenifustis flavocetrariae TaxID=2949735 RepID=A0AA41Z1W1_9HYPH|nr:methylated-DNA--[protein]-cysteine S-methyltransferase [Lichenifustis flavocetrariae]MCW6508963.1 methylated-DNA--[protein]-cysteine S-methyltransferase [Lichenifustis flavocetrariae]